MNLNKSTRYALYAAMEMAREEPPVTVSRVAQRYGIPEAVLAKVFQQLVRTGLAIGTRGTGGGYRLSREPSDMTVLDVLDAFEASRAPGQCLLAADGEGECEALALCSLRRLFDEVDEQVRATFASVSLETLVGLHSRPERELRILREKG